LALFNLGLSRPKLGEKEGKKGHFVWRVASFDGLDFAFYLGLNLTIEFRFGD
jgi:hypothetical protein